MAQAQARKKKPTTQQAPQKKKPKKAKAMRKTKLAKIAAKALAYDSEKMTLADAVHLLRSHEIGRPNSTYELTVKTAMPKGVPLPKGRFNLPHDFKKNERKRRDIILVFCSDPELSKAVKAAGADIVGGMELVEDVANGKHNPNIVLCTPALISAITKPLGRILGPRGLMPSERRGTVLDDPAAYINNLKASAEWRGDKTGVVRTPIGKVLFDKETVMENVRYFIQSVKVATNTDTPPPSNKDTGGRVEKNKPRNPITKVILSSTQGPGISLADII